MFLAEGADQPEMVAQDARCHFPGAGIQAFRSFFRALPQHPIGDGAASDRRCRGTDAKGPDFMSGPFPVLLVASEGFEPPNAMQSDLQSDPFGRLGNSPGRSVHMYSSDRRR